MFVLGNLLSAVAYLLNDLFVIVEWVIIIHVILTWANADRFNPLVRAVQAVSDPFLKPFRRLLPPWKLNGLDLSPALAVICLEFIRRFLIPTLYELAAKTH